MSQNSRRIALLFWALALITIPFWAVADAAGWDIVFYRNAIVSLHAGHDPYADATAIQDEFHRTLALHPHATTPFSYVYTPMTLPLLRVVGRLPFHVSLTLYWILLAAAALTTLWVVTRLATAGEQTFMQLTAPLLLFCAGLLAHDTLLSGNVAFLLYALVLLGAYIGWRRDRWLWCYLAILFASCFKPPLLCLIAIPIFSGRRQAPAVAAVGLAGVGLFAVQPLVWPSLFHNFLRAVELQFSYNRDFGSSPAGVLSAVIMHFHIPYSPLSEIFYALYAAGILMVFYRLSRLYFAGRLTIEQWAPVLLLGTVLLNPRIMEYDAAPLSVPMALIGWRFLTRRLPTRRAAIVSLALFLAANFLALGNIMMQITADTWKSVECALLIAFFTAGCWDLLTPRSVPAGGRRRPASVHTDLVHAEVLSRARA